MTKVSKNLMSEDMAGKVWKTLVDVLREVKTNDEVTVLLNDLFTPSEKIMLSKRLAIAFLSQEGKTYSEISKKLKVSFATINLVKSSKLRDGRGYKLLLDALRERIKL